ncbi:MAG: hypothetical protein BWY92_01841 [Firmicutes bacterium ADurb.BinA052]|nr:MAG: hypothetical protein BWY92_01841 [Firmicutes bacterium ADurb.BinA052]
MPYKTFIKVDLPAPFSPMIEWISPSLIDRSTWSRARVSGGYTLMRERISMK